MDGITDVYLTFFILRHIKHYPHIFTYGARSLVMHIASARATGPGFMILVSNFVSNFVKIGVKTCKIA